MAPGVAEDPADSGEPGGPPEPGAAPGGSCGVTAYVTATDWLMHTEVAACKRTDTEFTRGGEGGVLPVPPGRN
ncbi:hypothetical protein MTP06_45370 [Streptomyces sp. PLM4]|nr:hypothetical protein MTP06_45370 [Streptomyces sp. PLM4]